jgi:hypothetical protein
MIVWAFGIRSKSSGHNLCTYPIRYVLPCYSVSFAPLISFPNCSNSLLPPPPWTPAGGFEWDMTSTKLRSYLTLTISYLTRSLHQGNCRNLVWSMSNPLAFCALFHSNLSFSPFNCIYHIYLSTWAFTEHNPSARYVSPNPSDHPSLLCSGYIDRYLWLWWYSGSFYSVSGYNPPAFSSVPRPFSFDFFLVTCLKLSSTLIP